MTETVTITIEQQSSCPSLHTLLQWAGNEPHLLVLGDFNQNSPSRFSYLAFNPAQLLQVPENGQASAFEKLNHSLKQFNFTPNQICPVPFCGGWAGYFSYDLAHSIERLPDTVTHDIPLPLIYLGFYDHLFAWDNYAKQGYRIALDYPHQKTTPADRLAILKNITQPETAPSIPKEITYAPTPIENLVERMTPSISRDDYLEKVSRSIEYIKAGDIFEVNLSQRFACPFSNSPEILYNTLCTKNPADYSALIRTPDFSIVSASPELFLEKRSQTILTKPIKGTIPRGQTPDQDQANRNKLAASEKDIAELNMIIDLERNDLGKICTAGTVKVLQTREIEPHPTIFHAVATIAGKLNPNTTTADILKATFPGGSITGAPKIRSMEIIDELEPTARTVYTGSIGWIGLDGNLDLNIAIRTLIIANSHVYLQVGGAVVVDSSPQSEYDETIAKAAALLRAIWHVKENK